MTMYDGALNESTDYATLDATADNAPSPQVCSAQDSGVSYPAWKAFNQTAGDSWYPNTVGLTPVSLMVDLGVGREALVNKYAVSVSYLSGTNNDFKDWILQGSNDVSCAAGDAKNANGWTDLHTVTSGTLGTVAAPYYHTFSGDTVYRYYRIRVTDTVGGIATYKPATDELKLIGQLIPHDVSEASETTDTIDGWVAITADVSESSTSTDDVLGTKDTEICDVSEATETTDAVSVYQSNSICDVEEASESTDTNSATAGVDVDVSESSTSTDSVEGLNTFLPSTIAEASTSTDDVDCLKWSGINESVTDTFYIRDTAVYELAVLIQESLVCTDTTAVMLCLLIHDFMMMQEIQTINQSGTKTITEPLFIRDNAYPMLCLSLSDTADMADTTTVQLCLEVLEYLWFNELVTATGRLSKAISESLLAEDSVQFGYVQAISEALSVVDVASVTGALVGSLTESLVAADTVTPRLTMPAGISESLTLTETIASQGVLYNVIYETLHMTVTVELDGETWECYVLNTPRFLPSVYSGFSFNSYCVHENRAYGCKTGGIYELTGDTDAGVAFHTGVQFSPTVFGSPNQKRFRKAYVGIEGTTPKMVMETETAGEKMVYAIDSTGEVDASRSLQGKKWKLTITDFDELSFVKLYPIVLTK